MGTPENKQAVLKLQYQTSLALLESLKMQLEYFHKLLDIQLKEQISQMNKISQVVIDPSTCHFSDNNMKSWYFQEKLQKMNEKIVAYYKSAMACKESSRALGLDIPFFVDHVSELAQNILPQLGVEEVSTEGQGRNNEEMESLRVKEGSPTGQSEETTSLRTTLSGSHASKNRRSSFEKLSLKDNFDEASKARSPVQRLHNQERTNNPNPYSPESERKRRERKEVQYYSSPSKSPNQGSRNELTTIKKPKVDFDSSEQHKRYTSQGGPTVNEKEGFKKVGMKNATLSKMSLSTQQQERNKAIQAEEEYMLDSDTEYEKLSDVERKSSDRHEKHHPRKED